MPFKSEAQRRFMYSQHPKLAKEFESATPEGKDLPEHVKKEQMADGGIVDNGDPIETPSDSVGTEEKKFMGNVSEGFKEGMNHDSDVVRSYLSSKFNQLMSPEKDEKMADGGVPGVTFLENVSTPEMKKTVHLEDPSGAHGDKIATGHEENYAKGGAVEKSDDDKRSEIYKAMGMGKYAGGGLTLPAPTIPTNNAPDQNDPNFWESIKNALAKVAAPVTNPMGTMANTAARATEAATPVLKELAGPTVAAMNNATGLNLPIPPAPQPPAPALGTPTQLSAPVPPPQPHPAAPVDAQTPKMAPAPSGPDLTNLFNQDTSKLTEGVNASDRKQVADSLAQGQGSLGSVISQALAGLGDAIAAKGGREQHALKDIFGLQKQQRDEALANFDKERQAKLEKLDLQTKMGNNAINQLAAQDAYGVDEVLNKQIGAPPGTKHKDLPLYMQAATAKMAQQEKDTDLYMKAHKQAADEIESAVKNAGIFNIKPSPAQIQAQGAKLADQYFHRAKGNVLFKPSDGQKPIWIPAKNIAAAQKMDPQGQIVQ